MVFRSLGGSLVPAIGLIVEGSFDEEVMSVLVQRIKAEPVQAFSRVCGGRLKGKFVRLLRELQYKNLQKAIVISDADGRNPQDLVNALETQIQNQNYPFAVKFVVVVQELEAWLLADPLALSIVCTQRGRRQDFPNLTQSPETLPDPNPNISRHL